MSVSLVIVRTVGQAVAIPHGNAIRIDRRHSPTPGQDRGRPLLLARSPSSWPRIAVTVVELVETAALEQRPRSHWRDARAPARQHRIPGFPYR